MPRTYSNVEYADMVFVYGFCDGNATEAVREYARRFPNRRLPDRRVITLTFNRLREIGSFSIRQDPLRANLIENRVLRHFNNNPETSVRRTSAALQVPRQTIWRTLRGNNRHPYHIQRVQSLLPQDYFKRLNFSNWFLEQFDNDNSFPSKIMWTDEATFTRRGIINQRNSHVWANENPRTVREYRFQHEFAVNVWLGIWNDSLVGPFFLPDRLNAARYTDFLETDFSNYLEDVHLQ